MFQNKLSVLKPEESESNVISFIAGDFLDGSQEIDESSLKESLPILPLRNTIVFPGSGLPISVGRSKSLKLVRALGKKHRYIGLVCQKDNNVEEPEKEDLYSIGVIAEVIRVIELDKNNLSIIVQAKKRFEWTEFTQTEPYFAANYRILESKRAEKDDKEFSAILDSIRDAMNHMLNILGDPPKELLQTINHESFTGMLVSYSATNLPIENREKQELLSISDEKEQAYRLLMILNRETQVLELKMNIQMKTREDLNQQQKEYFLQQQIKTIQEELGGNTQQIEIAEFRKKGKTKKWSQEVADIFEKEISKLERLHPQSPDYSVQFGYLQTIVELPWNEYTKDSFNLKNAQKILDRDHFGMEKVKERIIEHLAVLKLKGDLKSPILCLYGPPGVGKTSLGKSIAEALNRKYIRVSLGGLHDEAEIRGHRRTYIGAIPGRIIQNIQKAGSSNPVFVLDEIDKVGNDFRGDPASALLEVLDPEQNFAFHDNYLSIDYDLSKVMFIATANNLNTIPQPLLDRMELINVGGYISDEKIEIAYRHLVPKQLENHGIKKKAFSISKPALLKIIEDYTRESGVRELDKKIAKVTRKIARKIAGNEEYPKVLKPTDVTEYLGMEEYSKDRYQGNDYAGVVTGLAWTAVGGEILFVESSLSRGKGSKLTLTGNLGDVMKESAMLAMEYIHANADLLDIDPAIFENWNTHIHVPEGAMPKDGPSAGITMITSLASAYTQRKVRNNLAMTGEITLRGKVLPVGGIREKILAAKRAGITDIILCKENEKDILEIKPEYVAGLNFHYVEDVKQVLEFALLEEKVENPKNFIVPAEKE
ncbi:MAG: endopeptidase La [Petrimonas sp.]|jgi:ATP-dependent Lon protease|uniref:endopeptidase La n=1 Tax=Petrimonas TaxID=307628 RepID=UPI000E7DD3FF|nr:endopeptidase La [Petrimonas sp.]NLU30293.1 endopeptidase La [Bacteroidales bacterium]BBD46607.1 ATP-dependent protease La [Petrimonas sp. IBARAKI]HAC72479.1 endopeptidase La [Porphyromonadaceae bacterium]MDD3542337.1 endopeptidase La [Petrimonas sp.]